LTPSIASPDMLVASLNVTFSCLTDRSAFLWPASLEVLSASMMPMLQPSMRHQNHCQIVRLMVAHRVATPRDTLSCACRPVKTKPSLVIHHCRPGLGGGEYRKDRTCRGARGRFKGCRNCVTESDGHSSLSSGESCNTTRRVVLVARIARVVPFMAGFIQHVSTELA
jgi:hypothetical protein